VRSMPKKGGRLDAREGSVEKLTCKKEEKDYCAEASFCFYILHIGGVFFAVKSHRRKARERRLSRDKNSHSSTEKGAGSSLPHGGRKEEGGDLATFTVKEKEGRRKMKTLRVTPPYLYYSSKNRGKVLLLLTPGEKGSGPDAFL